MQNYFVYVDKDRIDILFLDGNIYPLRITDWSGSGASATRQDVSSLSHSVLGMGGSSVG